MENDRRITIRQQGGETQIFMGNEGYPPIILEEGQEVSLDITSAAGLISHLSDKNEDPREGYSIYEFVDRGIIVDIETGLVKQGEAEERLTFNESKVLKLLLDKPGRTVSQMEFADTLGHKYDDSAARNDMKVYIRRIRKKLDTDPDRPLIHSSRSRGYYITGNIERHAK